VFLCSVVELVGARLDDGFNETQMLERALLLTGRVAAPSRG